MPVRDYECSSERSCTVVSCPTTGLAIAASRLVALVSRDRTSSSPLVGRDDDLELLRTQVGAAVATGTGRLVTVLGEAGVGKSRLLREFTAGLGGSARVVQGRCLPYGEGITFWPLAEAVRSAAAIAEDDHVDAARAKVFALAGDDADVSDRVASAIGLIPAVYAVEETFWGVRRLFETLAADRPLVVVIEDLHWAEPTLLELIDNVVERVGRPCVLVCTARPELLDRPDAPAEGDGRVRIALDRLGAGDATAMAERLLAGRPVDAATLDRIVVASDGNPLFMEQMAAMLDDADPAADFDVPPTILALLAARLDRLAQPERTVLEPASVAGLAFPSAAVVELTDESLRAGCPTGSSRSSGAGSSARTRRSWATTTPTSSSTSWSATRSTGGCSSARGHSCTSASRRGPTASTVTARPSSPRSPPTTSSRRIAIWPSWGRWTITAVRSACARASGWPAPASAPSRVATCMPRPVSSGARSTSCPSLTPTVWGSCPTSARP